jgi:hypothetical protein
LKNKEEEEGDDEFESVKPETREKFIKDVYISLFINYFFRWLSLYHG